MSEENSRVDSIVSKLSRRQALAGVTTLVTAGGSLVVVGEPAQARVSVESFEVSDSKFERESVEPVLDVVVQFDYDAGLEPVNALEFSLLIDGDEIASDRLVTSETSHTGDTTLSGSVLDSGSWDSSDFAVSVGEGITRELSVALEFRVVTSEGTVIVDDRAEDTATVEVDHPRESALIASVGGTGSIRAAED